MLRCLLATLFAVVTGAASAQFDHSEWDALVKHRVVPIRGGQSTEVDYVGIRLTHDRVHLDHYLASLATVTRSQFDSWGRDEQLAFLINAYNAAAVSLIVSSPPETTSIKDLGILLDSPWRKRFIVLLGQTISLNELEHGLIRKSGRYGDPRIHFALTCASVGSAGLRSEVYDGVHLEAQLDDAAKHFLSDRTRNRLDGDVLRVSSVFKWYRKDFESGWRGATNLGAFLMRYREALAVPSSSAERFAGGSGVVRFLDYDWRLNRLTSKPQ